jgi:glycosyltransferase involved in cell wall biosynthesis
VKVAGIRPLCHYLSEGYLLGNAPSKEFSPADYVARYMNGKLNQAPLVHYYRHGRHAGATLGDLSPAKLRLLQQERERDGDIQAIERETSPEDLARSLRDEITWRRALRDFGRRKRGASTERESKAAAGRPIAQRSPPASKSLVPPMVSIVVPTYNKREFLTDALKSAVDQSYGSIEVIVVDDGSTDGSGNVADAFASSHPAMRVVHQQNGGLSNARNRGIQEARGELIFFHDADDLMEPDAIANLVSVYEAHGSDVTGGVFRRRVAGQDRVVESFRKFEPELNFRHSIPLALHYATNLSSCNKLFRRSFLDAHGLRFADRLYMQDVDFWLRTMFLSENITQTAHVVATYVARPGSWSTQKTAGRFESLFDLFDRVANFFEENALAEFDLVRHFALIQAAIWFFAKWKLEEWPGPKAGPAGRADLRRIQDLLARIPAEHFTEFFVQKNKGIVVPTLLALRSGNFKFAKRVLAELPQQQYRQALSSNKAPSAEDLIAIAKNMLPDKVGVRQQNTSAELKS